MRFYIFAWAKKGDIKFADILNKRHYRHTTPRTDPKLTELQTDKRRHNLVKRLQE